MQANTYRIIEVVLESSDSLSPKDIELILRVCRKPSVFREQAEHQSPRLLTIPETAKALRVSRPTIYRLMDDGQLHPVKMRGAGRFIAHRGIRRDQKDVFLRPLTHPRLLQDLLSSGQIDSPSQPMSLQVT